MAKQNVTIRRAPRMWSFMMTGAFVGVLAALIITSATPVDPKVGFGATFGFFAVFTVAIGIALGGIVGVYFDRTARVSTGVAEVTEVTENSPRARKSRKRS